MTASHTLARSPILEQIPKHGILFMSGFGLRLQVRHGHLCAEWGIGRDRHKICLSRVNRSLKRVIVVGSEGFSTFDAIRWISDIGASFIFLDSRGKLLFASTPTAPSDVRLRKAQALATQTGADVIIARELISGKLSGQERVAGDIIHNSAAAAEIADYRLSLAETDTLDGIRLLESQGAAAYWAAWRDLQVLFPTKELPRIPAHWRTFGSRKSPLTGSQRLAINPPNSVLNYLYSLLEAESRLALAALGLDPGLGFIHKDAPARDSCASDLMEVGRPAVDAYVLRLLEQPLKRDWFFEQRNGNCRLMASFTAQLSETSPMWARAIAPCAERITEQLWISIGKGARTDRAIPTRLTQRRKIEGRGNRFELSVNPVPLAPKICEICGAEGVKNRYCKSCAVEVSRKNMAQVALIGHSRPKTRREKERVSKRISDHAVANTWWDPKDLPSWLTEECYVQRIQPLLRSKKVREIADVMGVSQPYAAFIRSGRRRPHPRHWQVLARLVGLSNPI
jgi:CRISPR-associated endonuclease Cas1